MKVKLTAFEKIVLISIRALSLIKPLCYPKYIIKHPNKAISTSGHVLKLLYQALVPDRY